MKHRLAVALGAVILGCGPLGAQEEELVSGSVVVASDYAFRGISQTLEEAAIQGGIGIEHPSGWYVGTWGSSLNFGEAENPRAQVELDLYGGFGFTAANLLDVDVGVTYYGYPGSRERDYDFIEVGLGGSRSFGSVDGGISASYSPEYFGGSGEAWYYGLDLGVPVSPLTVTGSIGHQRIEENETFGVPDYTDWSIGVGIRLAGFELSGHYVDTDLADGECFGGSDLCGGRAVVALSRGL